MTASGESCHSNFGSQKILSNVRFTPNAVEKVGFAAVIKFDEFFCAWAAQVIGNVATSEALLGGFSYDYYYPPHIKSIKNRSERK